MTKRLNVNLHIQIEPIRLVKMSVSKRASGHLLPIGSNAGVSCTKSNLSPAAAAVDVVAGLCRLTDAVDEVTCCC